MTLNREFMVLLGAKLKSRLDQTEQVKIVFEEPDSGYSFERGQTRMKIRSIERSKFTGNYRQHYRLHVILSLNDSTSIDCNIDTLVDNIVSYLNKNEPFEQEIPLERWLDA